MKAPDAVFLTSSPSVDACPPPGLPEYAFIGRSNVGKSSLINMLTGVKNLAKTSSTPGKTQLINHFRISDSWYIADLPGYGFAKVSHSKKEQFDSMIRNYLLKRKNLVTVFVLIDVRHAPLAIDLNFIQWLGERRVPLALVFTKADKLKRQELNRNTERYRKTLLETWEELPPLFLTSAQTRLGRDELAAYIDGCNAAYGSR
jgi:GTP-binding protein